MLQKSQPLHNSLHVKRAESTTRIMPLQKRIAVKTTDAVHLIKINDIIHCMADNNYCTIHYGKGLKILVAKTLKAVGDILPINTFLRVHNSHIVRLDTIHVVYTDRIVLDNGESIPLSRSCKKELNTRLTESATSL